jgi:hypothetical protein
MNTNNHLEGGIKWKRNVQSAKKPTQRLTPRKSIAVTPAPNKQTKENKGACF